MKAKNTLYPIDKSPLLDIKCQDVFVNNTGLIITGYGIIALGLSGIYGAKKEKIVYFQTFILTVVGLLCRYFLEFGEHSNTYNFTLLNVVLYILILPIFTVITYHFTVKLHIKNN